MRKTALTLIAVCATLLWVGAVHASNAGGLPECLANLTSCTNELSVAQSDLLTCDSSLSTCNSNLSTCNTDLTTCTNELSATQAFPATGQTTKYVVGDDGDIKAGAALSYMDNGDGTVTDNNTKLMWEKKDEASSDLHNVNNTYPWSGLCQDNLTPCGTSADCTGVSGTALCTATDGQGTGLTIFQWVAQLNAAAFAGHTDWRVPNVKELQSIVDYGTFDPAVATAFNTNCSTGCTLTTCSCTQSGLYWSATTLAASPFFAWGVFFDQGLESFGFKVSNELYVRAVRSGL